MPLRRLDAEEVRDSLVAVASRMNIKQFGRPDSVDVRKDGLVTSSPNPRGYRRSIYLRHRRKEMPTVLETFDLPQMNPNCEKRVNSTVAQQALYLLNNTMVRQLSESFAERVFKKTLDPGSQVQHVYLSALGRRPNDEEQQVGVETLTQLIEEWKKHPDDTSNTDPSQRALETYCHTIMNSAAFLYID